MNTVSLAIQRQLSYDPVMPFRNPAGQIYDQATLSLLQDVLEYVWLIVTDRGLPATRENVAASILSAYTQGMSPEAIREAVVREFAGQEPESVTKHPSSEPDLPANDLGGSRQT
jgi:hypothetical protein